ncbi:MAG: hypothetical protein K8S54_06215 [Spirochaetia bacterium]|nr:hypothetical protein [Spirochaetia bacterium]
MQRIRTSIFLPLILALAATIRAESPSEGELSPEERLRIIQEQERRWNLNPEDLPLSDPLDRRDGDSANVSSESGVEAFPVLVGQTTELVLKSGTRISIPGNSFKVPANAAVRAEVLELRKPRDFAFAGISTNTIVNGSPAILESAGMVRLRFLWNATEAILASSARLRLEMEPAAYGSFNVYRRNDTGDWDLKGNAKESRPNAECDSQSRSECPSVSTLIFDQIDRSGWWNFDEPKTEFTCITGTVNRSGADLRAVGVGRNWSSVNLSALTPTNRFQINVMRNERAKIIAVEQKDKVAWLGTLPAFITQDRITHTKFNNGKDCQEVGSVELKPISKKNLKDKESFLKAIQWEGE